MFLSQVSWPFTADERGEDHTQTQGGDLRTGVELEAGFVYSHGNSFEVTVEVRGGYIVL
jgi:hypothetical protein